MSQFPERSAAPAYHSQSPATHPDSSFNILRQERQQQNDAPLNAEDLEYDRYSPVSELSISPVPPPHREPMNRNSVRTTTPGADNFGDQAAGGIAGIALGVASANERQSGLEAMRNIQGPGKRPKLLNKSSCHHSQQKHPNQEPRSLGPSLFDMQCY